MDYDIVIVGAGAAGLIAARTFARAGRSVAVLEARICAGGRLRSVDSPRAQAPIELGGEFVHGRPTVTYDLLREYGATVVDDAEKSFAFHDGALRPVEGDPFGAAGELLSTALDRDEDESVDALVERRAREAEASLAGKSQGDWTRRLVAGFDAADTARASARAIAREWAGDASAGGAQSRPVGGYAPLIAHLLRSLDPGCVDLRFETVVTAIARDGHGIEVNARTFGRDVRVRARRALLTVPHGVLTAAAGATGAIAFEPALPAATLDAIAHIAMGPVVKLVLCFRTAVWETLENGAWRDGAFFIGDGDFPTLWTQLPRRANTLVAWAGGPVADHLSALCDEERVRRAVACAGRYFADEAAVEDAFECAFAHDWQRDPFARGAYSYVLVGGEHARETLAAPVDGVLWFAGEATAAGGEGGTVAGALQSGLRAARDILCRWAGSAR